MKRVQVRWSQEAYLDLDESIGYIRRDKPDAARRVAQSILKAASILSSSPRQGRVVPELWDQGITGYREVVVAPHRIIYRVLTDGIHIVAVLDGHRDIETILLQRLMRQ